MNQHTVKSYGDELNQLTAEVARMGGLAEAQVADAVDSVARRDVALAQAVTQRDVRLDAMHHDIEKKAIRLIALRQPVASDLRKTLAAMKLAVDLERTGDLARNIAKRALILAEGAGCATSWTPTPPPRSIAPWRSGLRTTRWTSTTTACSASF